MKTSELYLPEGNIYETSSCQQCIASLDAMKHAYESQTLLEAIPARCDASHNLIFDFGTFTGIMPREECALGIASGETKEIAILSRVGKATCFFITAVDESTETPTLYLSRMRVQQKVLEHLMKTLNCGDVIPAIVTHLEPFGAFVDIGCGIVSLIGIENLSISRIYHPKDRLWVGESIFTIVRSIDYENERVTLSHRELLGTWNENAALFSPGETVTGIVRSIEPYGVFIELTPNLSGLAELRDDLRVSQCVSVYIKSIIPERMKIKLTVIDTIDDAPQPTSPQYFITKGTLSSWVYTPAACTTKHVETIFTNVQA